MRINAMVKDQLVVRRVYASESRQMVELLHPWLARAPYSSAMDNIEVLDQCFQPAPTSIYETRWLQHDILGAWDGETLLGFIDVGTGYDQASLHLDGERPLGLLRFLAVPEEYFVANRVAKTLLAAADTFWAEANVRRIRAFTPTTGYPAFQSGCGILPGVWEEQLSWLSEAGYRLVERYYCLHYPLQRLVAETLPEGIYTFRPQGLDTESTYQLFVEDTRVAMARLFKRQVIHPAGVNPIAYLSHFEVSPKWRRKGLGSWLIRRLLNDAYLTGCCQLVVHVNHSAHTAISLFSHVGFEDINYRGYMLEKRL
ncbi:MAG: GNAT family N-acetyltransferase [Caldilineaceae bacterium]|nr:GNAT family N-acetyltransferase [Caldilineaceae bacterium]